MDSKNERRKLILQVVDNQIHETDPPETRATFERLCSQGYSELEAKELIGAVVVVEIFNVLKYNEPFNRDRFVTALQNLPELPFEEDV